MLSGYLQAHHFFDVAQVHDNTMPLGSHSGL